MNTLPSSIHLAKWQADTHWEEAVPQVEVTKPQGSLCQVDCEAVVGLHPDAVFETLCQTGNTRIFRNSEGVKNRRVVHEEEGKRVVELQLPNSWSFLWLKGSYDLDLRLTQDINNHQLHFELSKPGFMKLFQGSWTVEALPIPPSLSQTTHKSASAPGDLMHVALQAADVAEDEDDEWEDIGESVGNGSASSSRSVSHSSNGATATELAADFSSKVALQGVGFSTEDASAPVSPSKPWFGRGTRLASRVLLRQQVQPSLSPPPLFSHYLRGIAAKAALEAMCDIQTEAARLRYGIPETADVTAEFSRRGYTPLKLSGNEVDSKTGSIKGANNKSSALGSGPRAGLRDWGVASGSGAKGNMQQPGKVRGKGLVGNPKSRTFRSLSEKDKWKASREMQEQIKAQCPGVKVAVL